MPKLWTPSRGTVEKLEKEDELSVEDFAFTVSHFVIECLRFNFGSRDFKLARSFTMAFCHFIFDLPCSSSESAASLSVRSSSSS